MSKISDYADAVDAHLTKIDAGIDGIVADVQGLKDQIAALQNSSGEITPADQALLDDIQNRVGALDTKITALDDATPPVAPAG